MYLDIHSSLIDDINLFFKFSGAEKKFHSKNTYIYQFKPIQQKLFFYSLPISFIKHNCLVLIYKFIYSLATILAVLRTSGFMCRSKIVAPSSGGLWVLFLWSYTGVTSSIWSKSLNFFLLKREHRLSSAADIQIPDKK